MLRVTPIYGSSGCTSRQHHQQTTGVTTTTSSASSNEPSCTLLEYGGARVLVNIGWDDSYTKEQFPKELPDHDVLLITDSTLGSIGALPLYYKQMMKKHKKKDDDTDNQNKNDNKNDDKNGTKQQQQQQRKTGIMPKIYTTFPTLKMGQMTLYDYHASLSFDGIQPPFSLEDIDNSTSMLSSSGTFDYKITTLKYAQTITVSSSELENSENNNNNKQNQKQQKDHQKQKPILKITPNKSGHVIGNSFFVIQRIQDETIVVVTNTYCIGKELHLDSATLLKYGSTPDVLITKPGGQGMHMLSKLYNTTSSKNANRGGKNSKITGNNKSSILPSPIISQCEKNFIEKIMGVLRRNGNVLCPVDASGRVVELLLLLERHWDKHRLSGTYNICWVGPMNLNIIEYVKSQLEWMSKSIGDIFSNSQTQSQSGGRRGRGGGSGGGQGRNPFNLRNIYLCTTIDDVETYIESNNSNPTVILASGLTMDNGPSRDLLLKFYDNEDNAIILTDSSQCVLRNNDKMAFNKISTTTTTTTGSQQQDDNDDKGGEEGEAVPEPSSSLLRKASSTLQRQSSIAATAPTTATTTGGTGTATGGVGGGGGGGIEGTSEANQEDMVGRAILPPSQATAGGGGGDEQQQQQGVIVAGGADNIGISEYCTSGQLLLQWCQAKLKGEEMDDIVNIDVFVPNKSILSGHELQMFIAQEEKTRLAKKAQEERLAMLREVEVAKSQLRLGEDTATSSATTTTTNKTTIASTTQDGSGGGGGTTDSKGTPTKSKTDGGATSGGRPKKKSRFDPSLFLKYSRPLHLTFEVVEEAVGLGQSDSKAKYGIGESVGRSGEVLEDEYGISVKPERFVDIVSGVDPSRFLKGSGRLGDDVIRRGFGFGIDGTKPGLKRSGSMKGGMLGGSASNRNSKGRRRGGGGGDVDAEDMEEDDDDEEEMDEQALEAADLSEGKGIIRGRNGRPPMKVSTVPRKLDVLAEIDYVPLEGRVDARSARQSVRALQPRQVVILGGRGNDEKEKGKVSSNEEDDDDVNLNEVDLLAEAVRSHFASGGDDEKQQRVYTPVDGETAELSVGHAAYSVRLIDAVYQSHEEKEVAETVSPEPVEPYEAQLGECTVSLLDHVATGQKVALDGSIVLAPRSVSSKDGLLNQPSVYLSDGDVLLTDLRSEVIAQGMKAEYTAHAGYSQLVVNGRVIVKKDQDTGKIDIEGPLCEDFFTVRSIVCNQYVTLQ